MPSSLRTVWRHDPWSACGRTSSGKLSKIEIEYETWRRQQPVSLAAADRAHILALGEDLPRLWKAASAIERKQILRLVLKEVILDQRPASGQVWIRVIWQTGAVSEHKIRRNVNSYRDYADIVRLEAQVRDLVAVQKIDREIATALNAEGLLSARGRPFSGGEVHLLRKRWDIPTVKINGTEHNPLQWPNGTYSISISEVFDAEPPFTPRGCIAQAWSVAEVLRCLQKTAVEPE